MATQSKPSTEPKLPFRDLDGVIDATDGLLENVAGPWSPLLFAEKHRKRVAAAWAELRPSIPLIRKKLKNPLEGPHTLKSAGLKGQQLRLKLQVLSEVWKRFRERGDVKILASLISTLKTIVESLAKSIPFAEALKELLEFIEKLLTGQDPFTASLDAA
jgi:hypothetical protein